MPGRIPPAAVPTPGKLPPDGGPSVKTHGAVAGQPNSAPPGPIPNVPAEPPVNGNATSGWLNAGRNTIWPARPLRLVTLGASTVAGKAPPKGGLTLGR